MAIAMRGCEAMAAKACGSAHGYFASGRTATPDADGK
jgi:hypothetical protein